MAAGSGGTAGGGTGRRSGDALFGDPSGDVLVTSRRTARRKDDPPRRVDASMTLLREVMERPLDLGYAEAAARRAAGTPPAGRTVTAVVAVVAGILVTWSVVVLREPQPAAVRARALLVEQIGVRTRQNDAARARIEGLSRDIRRAQSDALTRAGDPAAAGTAAALGVISGDIAVIGPGLRIELDDAAGSRDGGGANSDPRADAAAEDGRVFDRDLQTVVNGLWAAGAEAVSINGHRLTALSAIRSAGEAILVDFRPLVPPYVVRVIGEPSTLQTRFAAGSAGAYLQSLADNYDIVVGIHPEEKLTLKGSGSLRLRNARPLESATSAPSPSPTPSAPAARPAALPSALTTTRPSSPEATS
jgi:uncharacterized protein YlxW (UPF0749 family)